MAEPDPISSISPALIYDGDCGICRRWVEYWAALTGPRVVYRPYQEAAADYPHIPVEAFARAIQLVMPNGDTYSGAAATFQVLRFAPGRGAWWWLYAHLPGFAPAAEAGYAFFASRRELLATITTVLWGRRLAAERYELTTWLFLRGLGLVYMAAFGSLADQVIALIGTHGILPASLYLREAAEQLGGAARIVVPTLFWLDASDPTLLVASIAGIGLGLLVVANILVRPALIGCFVLYLSFVTIGQDFLSFQWDLLLLETGFLAILLPGHSRVTIWLFRWLAFRYLLMAGAAKWLSGDATWRGLTALQYHFETQPLPTPLAWYAAQLPHWLLAMGTAAALVVEVVIVFLIFSPRRPRMLAAWCVLGFELLILATGNYNFFNLLTMLLCVFLFDDVALARLLPARTAVAIAGTARAPSRKATLAAALYAIVAIPVGLDRVAMQFAHRHIPGVGAAADTLSPFLIVNPYGLFAIMTTTRPEIVIEGSNDGVEWREYELPFKPGSMARRPPWNIPHQPRLDWQMWFAALGGSWEDPWFASLLRRLLEGEPNVCALFAGNPFPDHPPKYVRALLYDYRFADPATHAATGQWWVRTKIGDFSPALSLRNAG